jgi:hypothetical protein
MQSQPNSHVLFRIWMVTYSESWTPRQWNDCPPQAVAVRPAKTSAVSGEEAASFLEGCNSCFLETGEPLWGVAVPVTLCYAGDPQPGEPVRGYAFAPPAPNRTLELPDIK